MGELCLQPRMKDWHLVSCWSCDPMQWLGAGRGDSACHATEPALGFHPHVDAQT